jgi:DNA-binding transcriptional LysR family regulator
MDITLARTFLEVAASGSFVAAAERLFVTQSAVSLRVRRLEEALGRSLFDRSKAGAALTPAGREFERYALSLLRVWEEARQQVALPEGFDATLSIGAQYSLWPRLGFRWLDALRAAAPRLSLRGELGMPDRLTRFLSEGVMQMALMYTPQLRPGLEARQVFEDELVLVAAWPDPGPEVGARYVFIDWGPEFVQAHALRSANPVNPGLTLAMGALATSFVIERGLAAYLPARAVAEYLESGALRLVPGAPSFPFPAWVVWRADADAEVVDMALAALDRVAAAADDEQESILDDLEALSR